MGKTMAKLGGIGLFVLVLGCRTPAPQLKPQDTTEVLAVPPGEQRFNVASMPKEAFLNRDAGRKLMTDDSITQAGGSAYGPGTPSSGPMRK